MQADRKLRAVLLFTLIGCGSSSSSSVVADSGPDCEDCDGGKGFVDAANSVGDSGIQGYPSPSNTGVPSGWSPTETITGEDVEVTTAGEVVEDLRIVNGNLIVKAPNVTVRRVEIVGGRIDNFSGPTCQDGLLIEDTSIIKAPGQVTTDNGEPAVGTGSYTARRVKVDNLPEAFRVGGKASGCGLVTIEDSFARVVYPDQCNDWHGDGVQGYDGPELRIRNTTLELVESNSCGGTAPFFYPDQGNTSVDIDGLIVKGGGYAFRLATPGKVSGLKIVDESWGYGPIEVDCSLVSAWQAEIVTLDGNYQPTSKVKDQPCDT